MSPRGRRSAGRAAKTPSSIFAVGNARPLDQALQHATTEMLRWLGEDYGLDATEASHFLGQVVRYDIANVFNPAYSVCVPNREASAGRAEAAPRLAGSVS